MKKFVTLLALVIVAGINTFAQTKWSNVESFDSLLIYDVDHNNGITAMACSHNTILVDIPGQTQKTITWSVDDNFQLTPDHHVYDVAVMLTEQDTLILVCGAFADPDQDKTEGVFAYALRVYDLHGNILAHKGFFGSGPEGLRSNGTVVVCKIGVQDGYTYLGSGRYGLNGPSAVPVYERGGGFHMGDVLFVMDKHLNNLRTPYLFRDQSFNNLQILDDGNILSTSYPNSGKQQIISGTADTIVREMVVGQPANMVVDPDGSFWLFTKDSTTHLDKNWDVLSVNYDFTTVGNTIVFPDRFEIYGLYGATRVSKDFTSFETYRTHADFSDAIDKQREFESFVVYKSFESIKVYMRYYHRDNTYDSLLGLTFPKYANGNLSSASLDMNFDSYTVEVTGGDPAVAVSPNTILSENQQEVPSGKYSRSAVVSVLPDVDLGTIDPLDFVSDFGNFAKVGIGDNIDGALDTDKYGNQYYLIRAAMGGGNWVFDDIMSFRIYIKTIPCAIPNMDETVSFDTVSKVLVCDIGALGDTSDYEFQWVRQIQSAGEPPYAIVHGARYSVYRPTEKGYYALHISRKDSPWCHTLTNYAYVDGSALGVMRIPSSSISVYPNPSTGGRVAVRVPNIIQSIEIISNTGQIMSTINDSTFITTAELPAGVYMLRIVTRDNQVGFSRLVKI
jgi:hypothetical protein